MTKVHKNLGKGEHGVLVPCLHTLEQGDIKEIQKHHTFHASKQAVKLTAMGLQGQEFRMIQMGWTFI